MRFKSFSSSGVVLSSRDFGEADRIVSVYTKNHGRLTFIAKGVRRVTSKKRGHLEVFNYINFHAVGSSGMSVITEIEMVNGFNEIKKSLKKISLGYYISEVVSKITQEGEPNLELFNLIYETYNKLCKVNKLRQLRVDFVLNVLVNLGYWNIEKPLDNPDDVLEDVLERQIMSTRVGRKISI